MMVTLSRVAYDADRPLFSDVSLVLGPGIHGLVGANGAGKSTLLRLLAKELRPSSGAVTFAPKELRAVLVEQEASALVPAMRALAEDTSRDAIRLRSGLALDPAMLDRYESLSPGERKRWQLGAALLDPADVLLLDEPTNHLDVDGRGRLVSALRRVHVVVVVVSHDRALLDEITTHTLRIHRESVVSAPMPYSRAKEHWDAERAALVEARELERTRVERAKATLDRARREHEAARAQTSRSARSRDKNDSDARGIMAQMRADYAEATLGRKAGRMREVLGEKVGRLESIEVDVPLGRSLFVGHAASARPRLLARDSGPFDVHGRSLAAPALVLDRGDKVWLTGKNGAGKTTFLGELFGAAALVATTDAGAEIVVPQDLDAAAGARGLDELKRLPPEERGRVSSLLAALGVDPSHVLARTKGDTLSHGEIRKLWLALALVRSTGVVVLDEPTNHLDLPSIERLEAALVVYPGTLVLVTHDEALAKRVTNRRWHVGDAELTVTCGASS